MTETWNDVRRLADEIEVKLHLAGMEAKDRWNALQPRLEALQKSLESGAKRAGEAIEEELGAVGAALRRLRDDIVH